MRRLLVIGLLLIAAPAHAAKPPSAYKKARAAAPYHLQIAVDRVTPPAATPGPCRVAGKIVRIFRDRPRALRRGAAIQFNVSCLREGDPRRKGGARYTYVDALKEARFLEAYLDFARAVTESQTLIIDAASDTPQMPVD